MAGDKVMHHPVYSLVRAGQGAVYPFMVMRTIGAEAHTHRVVQPWPDGPRQGSEAACIVACLGLGSRMHCRVRTPRKPHCK